MTHDDAHPEALDTPEELELPELLPQAEEKRYEEEEGAELIATTPLVSLMMDLCDFKLLFIGCEDAEPLQ